MQIRIAVFLLFLALSVVPSWAQNEDATESTETTTTDETVVTTSTTTTSVITTSTIEGPQRTPPAWINLVRISAIAGPIAFLVLAWFIGGFVHHRIVRREQAQFPVTRGTRTPQITPMIISAALLFAPAVLFVFYEIRSRYEIRRGIGGIVDEWQPVTAQAWITLVICLVLALTPWLFARRADTVA